MNATLKHLRRLYAGSDDPWNFDGSVYESEKFIATSAALTRERYRSALELGCGNGALARNLAPRCDRYTGLDAVEKAVIAARARVPEARFVAGVFPCRLPGEDFDLVILSEFLYFLTPADIMRLGQDLAGHAPGAEVLCVTFLGDTEQELQGVEALELFRRAVRGSLELGPVSVTGGYRIDRGVMRGAG
jgi:SAM-dependent methyltransferase